MYRLHIQDLHHLRALESMHLNRMEGNIDGNGNYRCHMILLDLLKFVGFEMREITPSFISIPLPIFNKFMGLDWIQNFLSKIFPYFGDAIIVKAEKVDYSIWNSI